ncbi:ABC transporter permease [Anaerocolumna sp.]|uniref:ABC transporter permease n=1 Tax=Anaerocolumna sp. TaxID=2041569 RepID=UPI0028A63C2E|nr:FtsX-like permease family protein [Anaerocolumna sp.]
MKILFKSTIRHIKKHFIQTLLTFFMTILMIAVLSAIFNFAASFQDVLRRWSIDTYGTYHYKFAAEDSNKLKDIEEGFKKDSWFSEVFLDTVDNKAVLFVTVDKPGLFTTKIMKEKLSAYSLDSIHQDHNWELLVSYGDLYKQNGMYSFLLIFMILMTIITLASVLTLGAVLKISAQQRERDFALLSSIGASGTQISGMILFESMLYIFIAMPFGLLFGIYLLNLSRSKLDDMLKGLEKFPPVEIVISIPFMIAIIIVSIAIILISAYSPAKKAAKIRPIEAIRQNQQIYISKKEQEHETGGDSVLSNFAPKIISKFFHIEGQLAYKTHRRFKRQYYPVLVALSVNIALSMVLSSFSHYTNDVISMTYSGMDYNIDIQLSCDDNKLLGQTVDELMQISDNQLRLIRQTAFELRNPLPLSETGYRSGLFQGSGRQPDVVLLSVDDDTLYSICHNEGIDIRTLKGNTGIFINDQRTWRYDGMQEKGKLFHLEAGDILPVYSTHVSGSELSYSDDDAMEIKIAAAIDYSPEYTKVDAPTSLAILVSEDTFLSLEPYRPFAERVPGTHNIILRGMVDEAGELERSISTYLDNHTQVYGKIYNYDEQIREEQASIAGIRYLLAGLVIILSFICLFSNFIVTWTINRARIKEFAIFSSVGMTPESIRKMKGVESLLNSIRALILGTLMGIICSLLIQKVYLTEYSVSWAFPWSGLFIGILILIFVSVLSECIINILMKKVSIVESIRINEM